ncbi:MAG TPA: sodium:proton antiporter [Pyrinomonadaceae bacterium]|nr:sodium:proton antiporter [Pyrinomonadaceae bacterium]
MAIEKIEILLLIAVLVAMLAQRLRLPYTVGLVLAGCLLGFVPFAPGLQLTKELVFSIFLPPLIFEAAFYLEWPKLRKDLPLVLTLATVGVLVSAGVTAVGMHCLRHWEWIGALVFGVLIAATDPVSVIATFKEAGVHGRIRLLVEAESLFNDGTAAVAFAIVVFFASGTTLSVFSVTFALVTTTAGGLLCGGLVASAALLLAGRTKDHLVEITLTTLAAYGSFLLAEHFHFSGVLATLTAGLMLGNLGHLGSISDKGREAVGAFWEYAAFVANSLIFLLIGLRVGQQSFRTVLVTAIVAIALVIAGRAIAVYPISALFLRSRLRIGRRHQHILFWGGLRGALALALALGLPSQVPRRDEIITVAFAVVAFSILVQGLTVAPLLRRMGELADEAQEDHV